METPARATCTARVAALAAVLAALAGCGLEAGGLLEHDGVAAEDGVAGDTDGTVGADADATADGPLETSEGLVDGRDAEADDDAIDDGAADDGAADDGTADDGAADDGATDDGPGCIPGETRSCAVEPGACGPGEQTCMPLGGWGDCIALGPAPTPEVCDGLDNDCDLLTDEDLGETSCGDGACRVTVENCVGGVSRTCVPLSPTTCDAPPAYCHETTTGMDECGDPCTKVGPDHCYTVHPACLDSSPGTPTETPSCDTPRGRFDCGLTCEPWPNTIGADCVYCVNIYCSSRSGPDEAQFRCNNIPVPPTP